MALKAGYRGIKKFIADKLNSLNDVDNLATDVEVLTAISGVESVIGPVEDGEKASQAYAIGDHFIKDGKFCTAIHIIAAEATLTKNNNYVEGCITDFLQVNEQKATSEVANCTIDDTRNHCVKVGRIVTLRVRFTLAADQTAGIIIKVPFLSYLNPSYILLFDRGTNVLEPMAFVNKSDNNSYVSIPSLTAGTYELAGTYVSAI